MQKEDLANGSPFVRHRHFLSASLGVACSITISTPPLLANGPGTNPAFQPVTAPVASLQHWPSLPYAGLPNNGFSSSSLTNTARSNGNTSTAQIWHNSTAAALRGNSRGQSIPFTGATPSSHDLDLASAQANILASNLGGFHNLTIIVGGVKQVVSLDSNLTGGEAVAAEQVLSGGRQTVKLAADGQAIGGSISLNSNLLSAIDNALGGPINNLTIANGVKVIDSLSLLSLSGSLDNDGSILTASTTARASDTISAGSIINAEGAVIGSSSGTSAGLFAANPILNAATSVTNSGTISSIGNVTINAPAVYNVADYAGGTATISGRQSVNVNTESLTNSGSIVSTAGNVNAGNLNANNSNGGSTGNFNLLNNGGTIQALDGNINLTTDNAALTVSGGNLLSRQVNIKAEAGSINLSADKVSGVINASGDSVHLLTVASQNLGNIDTAGDPQDVVTNGNITISGTIATSDGSDLALIASGNIVTGAKAVIDTSNTTTTGGGNGGNLTLIAGANFSGTPNDTTATVASGPGSSTGGIIDLTGKNGGTAAITKITTAGVGSGFSGGYIEMVAYAGTETGSGSIIAPTKVTINASGSGTGTNGDVTLIAGANSGTAITTGAITGGQVTVLSQTPSAAAGGVIFNNGTSTAGIGGFTGTAASTTAAISVGAITSSQGVAITTGGAATTGKITVDGSGTGVSGAAGGTGGTINISALGNIVTGELDAFGGGGVGGGSNGSVTGGAGGAGGTIKLTSSTGSIAVTGNVNVSGGGGGGGAGSTKTVAFGDGGAGGTAGAVSLSASTNVTVSGEVYAYNGGAGNNGGTAGTIGSGGGGGGGGAYGGGGGGGAGGVSASPGINAGGGGGGGSLLAPGGGGAGTTGGGGTANGGSGGGYIALGAGGTASGGGSNGLAGSGTRGGNGGKGLNIAAGAGGINPKGGSGGASAVASGTGNTGFLAQVVAGAGSLNLTVNGGSVGSAKAPLKFEAGQLTVTGTGAGSAFLSDISGAQLNVAAINIGALGSVVLSTRANTITSATGGIIDVTGPVSGGTINFSTSGTTASIEINSTVIGTTTLTTTGSSANVSIADVISGASSTINTLGTITTSGTGGINSTTITLTSPKAITIATDAANLSVSDKTANVTITQGANALNLLTSSVAASSGATFTVDSSGQLNVVGTITGGTSNTITLDDTGAAGGINIGSTVTAGTVNITTAGAAGITATTTGKVSAGVITLTSANNIGSSAAVVTVDNNLALGKGNTLTIVTGATGSAYVSDLGTTDLTLNATSASSGLLSVSSAASAFNVVQAPYASITLADINTNTTTPGVITLNSGSTVGVLIGNGNGAVTINSTGSVLMNPNTTGIEGSTVNLTSTLGDVGGEIGLVVNSANITASAAKGETNITTSQTGTVNFTGGSGVQLYVTDTANSANLIVNGTLACQVIQILCTGTGANLTTNGTLGISAKDLGYQVQLNPTGNLTINGNIVADDVFLGSNKFTGLPVLLGTVLVNGTVTADQTVELADNQSQGLTINGAMTGNQVIMMSDIANININASITTKTDPEFFPSNIKLSSQGANIVFAPGVTLTATGYIDIDMATGTGAIGSLTTPLTTKALAVDLTFGGSVYINNTGTVQLFASSTTTTGAFAFNNTGGGVALVSSGGSTPTFSSVSSGSIIITATGPITIGTSQDTSSTSLISTGVLTLTGTGAINNYGTISGANVTIAATSFNNINPSGLTATLAASSAMSISNPAGALTITGTTGSITTPAAGALSLIATGAITVGNSKTDPLSDVTTSDLHSLVVSAGGNFSVGWSGLTVVNDGTGDGGIINIAANNLIDNGAKLATAFDLFANGSTATGATIVLDIPGNTAALTTGAAVGDYNISAVGTNGATIFIQTGGNLTANMSNLLYNGTSGTALPASLTLIAGGKLLINGNIDTHTGTGAYGPVALSSGSPLAFVVGGAAGTLNGQIGISAGTGEGIFGSTVTITDNAGITINSGFDVEASTGNLALNTTKLTNSGTLSTPGALTITNKGNITYPPPGSGGTYNMAGLIIDSTGGNISVTSAIAIQPLVPLTTLKLLAPKGTLTLPSSTTSLAVAALAGGNGGTLDLSAKTLKSSLTALSAAGSTGSGGSINFTLTGSTAVSVGTGGLTFDVANGSGSTVSGSLTVANSGNLTVNGNGLNLGTGTGANLTLAAGTTTAKGVLLISNIASLVTAAQPFNNLILQSNCTQAFSLGGATTKTNGIVDVGVALTAQTMTIANYGGGITQGTAVGAGGTLTALAATKGAMDLVAGKGGIGVSSITPLTVSAAHLAVSTSGSAFINNTNASAVSLDAISVSKTLDYTSTAGIAASANLLVPTLILNVASIAPVITTSATTLTVTATSGALAFADTQTATVTVNTLSSSGSVSLTSEGAITTAATSDLTGSAITLTAGGKAAGNITIGNSLTSSGTVDLTAAGKGIVTESGKTAVVNAGTLNLVTQGGNIGASQAKPFVVVATILSTNTGTGKTSSAFIKNNAASTTLAASTLGSTFNYTGSITAASGPITAPTLILTLSTMNTTLTTNATTLQGTTAAGKLDITDTQTGLVKINTSSATAAGGQISITSGGAITTAGVISGSGAVVLTAGGTAGAITIGKNITSLTTNVTLQATGSGAIIESSGIVTASPVTGTVSLITAGGNIGSAAKSVATNAATITLAANATGNVYLTNTDSQSTGTVSLSSASVGSLKLTETNTSAKNTVTLTVNSINAGGSTGAITIASNEQALYVAEGSTITTTNGNITFQNTYVANGTNLPSISIGNTTATTIHAFSTGSALTGNVFIALGTVATASTVKPGVIPLPNPTTSASTTPNLITYGTTSNPNGSIKVGTNDTFTSLSGNLSFTTGKNAFTQITVGSNVTIIADPPLGVALQTVVPSATTISSSTTPLVLTAPPAVPSVVGSPLHDAVQTQIQGNNQNQDYNQNLLQPQLQLQYQSQSQNLAQLQSQGLTQIQSEGTKSLSTIAANAGNSIHHSAGTLSPTKLSGKFSSTNHETLDNGASLFAPKQDTIVGTPFGRVGIAKGAIALVIASENGLAVYDLHDVHKNSIFIDCGQGLANLSLTPGRSAVFTHQGVEQFEKINPAQKVAYKKIASRPIGSEHTVYQGEFEIFSMIQSLGPLRNMLGSNDSAMRKTATHMIKTAAILLQLTDGEPYSLFAVPEVTASLPTLKN